MDQQTGWIADHRGHRYWTGPRFWTTVVDGTKVEYVTDRPVAAYDCIATDGTRVTVVCAAPSRPDEEPLWFLPRSDGTFLGGKLEPSTDGLRFVEAPVRGLSASMYWQGGDRGRSVAGERGGFRWHGPAFEAELHGPAVIEKWQGRRLAIRGCRFSDGSRGSVLPGLPTFDMTKSKLIQNEGRWRRQLPDGSWSDGGIEIMSADIVFTDDPPRRKRRLEVRSPDDAPSLRTDLLSSQRIADRVKNICFATDLYRALCNTEWMRNERRWQTSWRSAGGIIADLRDLNEEYTDFYCSGDEGVVAEDVAAELRLLGWTEAS